MIVIKRRRYINGFGRESEECINKIENGRPEGWTTSLPGDNNLYATHYDALNAIDNALGGTGIRGSAKRMKYGINIIGQKNIGEI